MHIVYNWQNIIYRVQIWEEANVSLFVMHSLHIGEPNLLCQEFVHLHIRTYVRYMTLSSDQSHIFVNIQKLDVRGFEISITSLNSTQLRWNLTRLLDHPQSHEVLDISSPTEVGDRLKKCSKDRPLVSGVKERIHSFFLSLHDRKSTLFLA